jgi:drug/metabolite transporter (DMT)-like permease
LPYVTLSLLSLLWGTSFLLIKIAAEGFDWTSYATGRAGIAALALIAFALARRTPWPRAPRLWGRLAIMSVVGQAGPFLLFGVAAHLTTSADMALMMGSAPIFTFLIARLAGFGEAWNARAALGLAIGLAGVAIALAAPLAAAPDPISAPAPGLGRALALVAALGYSIGALMSRGASREVGAAMAATSSMTITAALLAVAALVVDGAPSAAGLMATPHGALAALVTLGLFNTALAYFVYFRLIESAGATFAALNNYIVPCLGVIAGALALGEPVGPSAGIGLACVLIGVTLTGSAARVGRRIAEPAGE